MCRILSECLNALSYDPRFDRDELAEAAGVTRSTWGRWLTDEGEPRASSLIALIRYTAERGDLRLLRLAVPPTFDVSPAGEARSNGVVDDEVTDAITALGRATEAHRSGDGAAMDAALARLDDARARLTAERQRLST